MLKHWGAGYKRGHISVNIDLHDWLNIVDPSFSFPYDRVTFCFLGFRSDGLTLDWSERERTDTRVCGHGGIKAREDIREDIFSGFFCLYEVRRREKQWD